MPSHEISDFSKSCSSILTLILLLVSINPSDSIVYRGDSVENNIDIGRSVESDAVYMDTENFSTDPDPETQEERELREGKEKLRWKGWNYLDTTKGWTPHEKTVSLQYIDDDGKYTHAPPAWPHDEYLLNFPTPNRQTFGILKNGSEASAGTSTSSSDGLTETNESNIKDYQWQRLRPRPPKSLIVGPGFYDYAGSSSSQYPYPEYAQAITDGSTSVITGASASAGGDGQVQIPNAVSESLSNGKLYPGQGYPHLYGNGYPHDLYRRKRLRLRIHPGLIVAPIAGFAAYKAVSAIASKPLLFELGWVNNKPNIGIGGGGWGFQPPYYAPVPVAPVVPLPNPYPVHPIHVPLGHNQGGLKYPILRPQRRPAEAQKSAWWNPFAALTPRFRSKKTRQCCDRDGEGEGE